MNLCASNQWEMVYWLVLCCNKIRACVLSYKWPCFQKASGQLDCIFVQGPTKGNLHTGKGKSFCSVNLSVLRMSLYWSDALSLALQESLLISIYVAFYGF